MAEPNVDGRDDATETTYQLIVRVARQLFYERGVDGTSMQDIASGTELHKSSLYHHFPSKDDLIEEVCRENLVRLEEGLDIAVRSSGDPVERLTTAFTLAAGLALEDIPGTNIILSQRTATPSGARLVARRRQYETRFATLVKDAQDAGLIRRDVDPALLTRILLGMINWVVVWYRPDRSQFGMNQVREALQAILHGGIWPQPPG